MWKYALAWIPLVFIAIANGTLREWWYAKYVGELAAHQLSTASGILFFGVYIRVVMRVWRPDTAGRAVAVGLLWLAMTIAFEFVFGHYVRGLSWNILLHDYNIFAGRLWLLVLVWVTLAPAVFYRLQK